MGNKLELPDDKELAKTMIDNSHELERKRTQNGVLGRIWGEASSAPNNIAALIIIFWSVLEFLNPALCQKQSK